MATYNCTDSTNPAYGTGDYGTCATTTQSTSTSVGAPNTGGFIQFLGSGSFTILVPLLTAIVIVVIATVVTKLRKKVVKQSTDASLSPSHDE